MGIDSRLPIPTTSGWLPASMIKAGDEVFSYTGEPVKVALVQHYTPPACYKLWLKDGLTLVVDNRTGIPAYTTYSYKTLKRWSREHPRKNSTLRPYSAEKILSKEAGRCRVPVAHPIRPKEIRLPVDPYEFGRWLFDVSPKRKENRSDIIRELIERYPTIPTHIPEEYLFASYNQRLALLKGILSRRPKCFSVTHTKFVLGINDMKLARQVQNLVESLGMQTTISRRLNKGYYYVNFRSYLRLSETQVAPKKPHEMDYRRIYRVEQVPPRECTYIKTDDPTNTILVSEGFLTVSL